MNNVFVNGYFNSIVLSNNGQIRIATFKPTDNLLSYFEDEKEVRTEVKTKFSLLKEKVIGLDD